jgi:DNA-binding response OmpR family regulator
MKSILLVEDDPFLVDLYNTKLKEEGFEVEIAVSGREGLRKFKEKKPDLILLDIVLPDLDGWEVLEEIKKLDKLDDLKIIVLSNLTEQGDVKRAQELGATRYLIKSHFTPSEVVGEIKKIIEK